ncbi:MAG TPA: DUF1501 domain-containing protein [Chthoniobacter sp.]|nr:DUF1501 domain-containing protein [Chthoniobacter sp.]
MKSNYISELQTRRRFLRHAACAAVGTIGMTSILRDMRFMSSALAQSNITDYKALICVFLNGGNDANNMIIPTIPSEWQSYAAARSSVLAIPNTDGGPATALALTSKNGQVGYPANDNHTYGLHPAMPELASLFNAGHAATLFNVGTLSYPISKAQYNSGSVPKPPQLYSHSDQQTQWQTSIPDQPAVSGWGGRLSDLMTTPVNVNSGGQISMAITLAGSNIFEVGNVNAAPQYSVSTGGAVNITNVSGARLTAMQSLLSGDIASTDLQTSAYASVLSHAINEASIVSTSLGQNASASFLSRFPSSVVTPNGGASFSSSLMNQMKMVARLIDIGSRPYTGVGSYGLGMKRQIFFIQVGGYDTHTVQTTSATSSNPSNATVVIGAQAQLLAELSQTLNAFSLAMGDMGLANNVTAFTMSDFGRTFPSNGSGSDHGWGSHHFVVGGAVKGGATYGKLPTLTVNGPDDTGTGRWIPTTSVDQYAATLANWFGVDASNLSMVFPNLGRFASSNLGFI